MRAVGNDRPLIFCARLRTRELCAKSCAVTLDLRKRIAHFGNEIRKSGMDHGKYGEKRGKYPKNKAEVGDAGGAPEIKVRCATRQRNRLRSSSDRRAFAICPLSSEWRAVFAQPVAHKCAICATFPRFCATFFPKMSYLCTLGA